ncbi:hypothetical protein P153DRAFT_352748 [Dothidotthia symphoricarpi CBS 119687]|uniref:Secreted protein n=1 Tax=Dothidotthia symphoricarpi CBS 119687 TaxID=1392245 RepID=A0A6A6AWA9_9PLEO|nr:uncharacterized protein P153DRAFT_352748 [Dothidotthia symphoricarpi CBS 119687]KAF2134811.1 hypothetical protein P153DRAFT_352748 [Dothidotthia symphoricarpi CBS 119687]
MLLSLLLSLLGLTSLALCIPALPSLPPSSAVAIPYNLPNINTNTNTAPTSQQPGWTQLCTGNSHDGVCLSVHSLDNTCTTIAAPVKFNVWSITQHKGVFCTYHEKDDCSDKHRYTLDSYSIDKSSQLTDAHIATKIGAVRCHESKGLTATKEESKRTTALSPNILASPGRLVLCPDADFRGECVEINALNICVQLRGAIWKHVYSMIQSPGAVCYFVADDGCNITMPVLIVDSKKSQGEVNTELKMDRAERITGVMCGGRA